MITNLFLSFLEISVSLSFIVAVLILLTPFLNKRYAAKWKYLIWIVLGLRLLIPFNGMDVLSQTGAQASLKVQDQYTDTPTEGIMPPRRLIVEIPAQMTTPLAGQSTTSDISITLLDISAFVWMTGGLILLSIHLFSYLHFKRQVVERGTVIENLGILQRIRELKRELHIKGTIRAVQCPEAASPMIIGFWKPVLVLPEEQYSEEEQFFILKHELVHWKRGDVYFKLFFVVVNAVHWLNPLIWIMQKEAAVDMELSCDERVTQGTDYAMRKAYTETLLSTLHRRCAQRTVLSTQFYGGKQIMKKRFKNILKNKGKKNGIAILIGTVILTISLGTLVGCAVAKEDAGNVSDLPENENIPFEQIAGSWMIDFDRTDHTLWGTGISYGNEMTISETGEFSYYIGIGVGGTGQCEDKNGEITVGIEPYEENMTEKEILTLQYGNDNGYDYIHMDWHDEEVYWKRIMSAVFVSGMGCSDPYCTDISHHHDCPQDCDNYDHYHNCDLNCTEADHCHGGTSGGNESGQYHREQHHEDTHH